MVYHLEKMSGIWTFVDICILEITNDKMELVMYQIDICDINVPLGIEGIILCLWDIHVSPQM